MSDELLRGTEEACAPEPVGEGSPRVPLARRLAWLAVVLATLAALNAAITFVFEYYGCSAEITWTQYRLLEPDSIDTVSIGTSVALQAFDPYVLDEHMDASTFNLSFYGLGHSFSKRALEQALADHGIKRVFFGLSPDSMSPGDYNPASVMFTQYKMVGEPLGQRLDDLRYYFAHTPLGSTASLEMLFPWTINNLGGDVESTVGNVQKRLTHSIRELSDGSLDGTDTSKGFRPFEKRVVASDALSQDVALPSDEASNVFSASKIATVGEIAALCEERGVELYVVVMPQPTYEVLSMGDSYRESWGAVRDAVCGHGATFIDMNMVKPDEYAFAMDEFCDNQHLNAAGAQRFSAYFAELVTRLEQGEDALSGYFEPYDEWDGYLASLEGIQLVNYTTEADGDLLRIVPHLYAGSDLAVEYELQEYDEATDSYETLVPYGSGDELAIALDGERHTLRLLVREVGSDAEFEHWCRREVMAV